MTQVLHHWTLARKSKEMTIEHHYSSTRQEVIVILSSDPRRFSTFYSGLTFFKTNWRFFFERMWSSDLQNHYNKSKTREELIKPLYWLCGVQVNNTKEIVSNQSLSTIKEGSSKHTTTNTNTNTNYYPQ